MSKALIIRDECEKDVHAIAQITIKAFAATPYSDGSEAPIIEGLRERGHLALSLVAADHDAVVGHVAFSRVSISESAGDWYGLGPISVDPDRQSEGIGRQLIEAGLERLQQLNATGCVLVGDPAFYRRFGFRSDGNLTYPDMPNEFVQWLSFDSSRPAGEVTYSEAFG